jgi:hypothetical protein
MPSTLAYPAPPRGWERPVLLKDSFSSAPNQTDWIKLRGIVAVQLTGAATSVGAVVERSTDDPGGPQGGAGNPAPAGQTLSGSPSAGMPVGAYDEPAAAWWRVRLTAVSGGACNLSISGQEA